MPGTEIRLTDPVEALVVEQALALVRELRRTCQEASHGHVLAQAEVLAVARGRELTRAALEAVLNQAASPAEKKGPPTGPVRAPRRRGRARA